MNTKKGKEHKRFSAYRRWKLQDAEENRKEETVLEREEMN